MARKGLEGLVRRRLVLFAQALRGCCRLMHQVLRNSQSRKWRLAAFTESLASIFDDLCGRVLAPADIELADTDFQRS